MGIPGMPSGVMPGAAASGSSGASGGSGEQPLIAVSADVVEIDGQFNQSLGFNWTAIAANNASSPAGLIVPFGEGTKPPIGLFKIGDFARMAALQTSLNLIESEGKGQILTNPKVLVASNEMATFSVGAEIPYPATNFQGVGVDMKKVLTELDVKPSIDPNHKNRIGASFQLMLNSADYGHTVTVAGSPVPTITTRSMQSSLVMKSGETIVMGGFKQSQYSTAVNRVPFLGSIPLLGALFTSKTVVKQESTLYIFLTMEIVR